jgi:hypothetical protein
LEVQLMIRWLSRWLRRDRIAEIDRTKFGAIPTVTAPKGCVIEDGEIVHAIAHAKAETESGKSLGAGLLILTNRGMAFVGGKRPVRYGWRQIESSGVRFIGRGSYSIDTKRGRTIDFHLMRRWDAEQIHAVDYALNAPDDD